jgi:hypothetical protein
MEQPRQPESPTSTIGADDENKNVSAFTHLFGMKQEKVSWIIKCLLSGGPML